MKPLTPFLFLLFPMLISAQNDLSPDYSFFQEQGGIYEGWMEHVGLSEVLGVHKVELDTQSTVDTLFLTLTFHTENTDTVIASWEQLKRDFEAYSPLTLEQQLFYKMVELMELEQERCHLRIYDNYGSSETPCLFIGISFKDTEVRVVQSACKSEIKELYIPVNEFSGLKSAATRSFQNLDFESRQELFKSILDFSRKRFEISDTMGSNDCYTQPVLRIRENQERLRFEAEDLCRHVLYNETNNLVCRIYERLLGRGCSTIKRERLTFTFTLEEALFADRIKLTCEIDGKYSDNWFSTGRGAYEPMEGEFDEYLELFADTFAVELEAWLRNTER